MERRELFKSFTKMCAGIIAAPLSSPLLANIGKKRLVWPYTHFTLHSKTWRGGSNGYFIGTVEEQENHSLLVTIGEDGHISGYVHKLENGTTVKVDPMFVAMVPRETPKFYID